MGRPISEETNRRKTYLNFCGYEPDDVEKWSQKWRSLRSIAVIDRKVECNLTFYDYVGLAHDSGLKSADDIGRGAGKYQMGRIGDTGNYEVGNCRFITQRQNLDERALNGGDRRGAEKRTGQKHPGASEKLKGRTKETNEGYKRVSEFMSKSFVLTSPEGIIYRGTNLSEFCKGMGLSQGSMSSVIRGVRKHHKGWTGKYVESV